jgi:hypothetical protein
VKLETEQDRAKETLVVRRLFTSAPDIQWHPFPTFSAVDYVCVREGRVLHAVEVKTRTESMAKVRQYPGGLLLKRRKFNELIQIEQLLNIPAYACFGFSNGTGHVVAARPATIDPWSIADHDIGRRDRDLNCDLEPVVLLDWDKDLTHWLDPLAEDL